jgi:hypothetical protein
MGIPRMSLSIDIGGSFLDKRKDRTIYLRGGAIRSPSHYRRAAILGYSPNEERGQWGGTMTEAFDDLEWVIDARARGKNRATRDGRIIAVITWAAMISGFLYFAL